MQRFALAALTALFLIIPGWAQLIITPTTTLTAERANNTSAADTFVTSANNNLGAGNVSKLSIRSLLYPNSNTGIYVHVMPWWGSPSHINIGYDAADPAVVKRQVTDMMSRGIQGAIVDWYGPGNTHSNDATIALMKEAETRSGQFKFGVVEDGGALRSCAGAVDCNVTSQLISDLTYVYNTFMQSSAYLRIGGRPVVHFFAPDRYGALDWARVKASVPGNPIFIFQNSSGFSHDASDGSFSWVGINRNDRNDWAESYLTGFYNSAKQNPGKHAFGSTKKGFDDTVAGWSELRIVNQNCGQTWLDTFKPITSAYSASNQLESLQLVTWNDYEEGSELETGIDNCVFVTASLDGPTLQWQLSNGSQNTVNHYRVYVSQDGENLMRLKNQAASVRALDLAGLGLSPGSYTFYVKAIGKPTMSNKMSNPVRYVVGKPAPSTSVTLSNASGSAPLTVSATMTASDPTGVRSTSIDFGDGTVVNNTTATHTYSNPGTYRVLATAANAAGASSASAAMVTANNQRPVAVLSASPSNGTAPVGVSASAADSYDPDGAIAYYKLDFGDGSSAKSATATHVYTAAGTYTITAVVKDQFGEFATTTSKVTVGGPKVTIAAPVSGTTTNSPLHVAASATSGAAITNINVYDGKFLLFSGTGPGVDTYVKVMPDAEHRIAVQAVDANGASGSATAKIWVNNQAPVAALSVTPASGLAPLTVTASSANSTDPDSKIASSVMDFGDGTVVRGTTASHVYKSAGKFTVKTTVSDGLGGTSSASRTVSVYSGKVTIQSPANNVTVSPVHVVGNAVATQGVSSMKVYVDNVAKYGTTGSKVDTYINMAGGTHGITVQAWDRAGGVFKSTLSITVR